MSMDQDENSMLVESQESYSGTESQLYNVNVSYRIPKDDHGGCSKVENTLVCEPCHSLHKTRLACMFCPECENEPLCESCSHTHVLKSTSSHRLIPIENFPIEDTVFCVPCASKLVTIKALYSCTECNNDFLCRNCSDTHKYNASTCSHDLHDVNEYKRNKSNIRYCGICVSKNVELKAMYVCQQCDNEWLCGDCADTHRVMKSTQSHELVKAENFHMHSKTAEASCDLCASRNVKTPAVYVCHQCDNEWLCQPCADTHRYVKSTRSHELMDAKKFQAQHKPNEEFCNPCAARNDKKTALFVCLHCDNEWLCQSCADTHKSMKYTRSHEVLDALTFQAQNKQEERVCDPCSYRHVRKTALFVCLQCDNECLCQSCSNTHKSMKSTRSHDLVDVKTFQAQYKPEEYLCDPCALTNLTIQAKYVCPQCDNKSLCDNCAKTHRAMKSTRSHELVDVKKCKAQRKHVDKYCYPCASMNVVVKATCVCLQCDKEWLCDNCANTHKVMKSTLSHELVDERKFQEQKSMPEEIFCNPCTFTNDSTLTPAQYICLQCDNEWLCLKCHEYHKAMKSTCLHSVLTYQQFLEKNKLGYKQCLPCLLKNIKSKASFICEECDNEYLCEPCSKTHQSMSSTGSHILTPLKDLHKIDKKPEPPSQMTKQKMCDMKTGQPLAESESLDTIVVSWSQPDNLPENFYYQISFKENVPESMWRIYSGAFTAATQIIENLKSDTEYVFRVRVVYGDVEGPYSAESIACKTLQSPASGLVSFSTAHGNEGVSPRKLALQTTEIRNARNEKSKTRKFELGAATKTNIDEKTIMVIGETGTGKSTLVDGMVNYVLGVNWSDPFRFTIVNLEDEEEGRKSNQALSQTEWITCYTINHTKGNRIPYTLHIIDTPGFGDTRGIERDQAIVEQIRALFSEDMPKGILTIDAVCFLIKAPDARLTPMQSYIFQSIMSLFGKDIESNICSIVTFADGTDPPVFAALDESELPFGQRFTFNNSGLYAKNKDINQYSLSPLFWDMGKLSFRNFFNHLLMMQPKSITLTREVLTERMRLEMTVKNLQPKLDAGLIVVNELKCAIKLFEDNKSIIKENKNFNYITKTTKQIKKELPRGRHVTNCTHCHFTCHENCKYADDSDKKKCSAMGMTGYCEICPDNCFWKEHANTPYIFKFEVVEEEKTYADMKNKYESATGKAMNQEQVIKAMQQDLASKVEIIDKMICAIMQCKRRLGEIALRPNPLTMTDHLDLMIENEKNVRKPWWKERIKSLENLKKQSIILDDAKTFSQEANSFSQEVTTAAYAIKNPKDHNIFKRIKDLFDV